MFSDTVHWFFRQLAAEYLESIQPIHWIKHQLSYVQVAIHIRRGNFLFSQESGFAVANADYFHRAMDYFVSRYPHVQFVAISTDKAWTMTNIIYSNKSRSNNVIVHYAFGHSAQQDMAIMAACDHVIISSGTFGWWGAWLANANGTKIYYGGYPRNASWLAKGFVSEDYYPSTWIKMWIAC